MNIENVLKVADAIEAGTIHGLGFNMGDYLCHLSEFTHDRDKSDRGCGTIACIAGWAYHLAKDLKTPSPYHPGNLSIVARQYLGLIQWDSNEMFLASSLDFFAVGGTWRRLSSISQSEAVGYLRQCASSGRVLRWIDVLQ